LFICQTTFTPILLGVCVAHALHDPRSYRFAGWIVRGVWAPAIYLALLIALLVALPLDISGLPRLGVQVCMALLLMSCVYHENHVLRPLLSLAPVKEIGKVSYGIYLLHIPVIAVVAHLVGGALQGRPLLAFVVELAPTLVLAELSFRLFESRFLRYKRRFSVVSRGALPRGDSLGTPRVALLVET
jgi:peptidoglycan/LPS O-acetylase OafA/YrhL